MSMHEQQTVTILSLKNITWSIVWFTECIELIVGMLRFRTCSYWIVQIELNGNEMMEPYACFVCIFHISPVRSASTYLTFIIIVFILKKLIIFTEDESTKLTEVIHWIHSSKKSTKKRRAKKMAQWFETDFRGKPKKNDYGRITIENVNENAASLQTSLTSHLIVEQTFSLCRASSQVLCLSWPNDKKKESNEQIQEIDRPIG